jgi:hypothetical protein
MKMIRTSAKVLSRLKQNQHGGSVKPRAPRPSKLKLSENDVEAQVVSWLKTMGWRVYRMSVGARQNSNGGWVKFGEKGVADYMAWRVVNIWKAPPRHCELLFLEVKRPGEKPSAHQVRWLEQAQWSGVNAWWVDSLALFQTYYAGHFGRRSGDAPGVGL